MRHRNLPSLNSPVHKGETGENKTGVKISPHTVVWLQFQSGWGYVNCEKMKKIIAKNCYLMKKFISNNTTEDMTD